MTTPIEIQARQLIDERVRRARAERLVRVHPRHRLFGRRTPPQ